MRFLSKEAQLVVASNMASNTSYQMELANLLLSAMPGLMCCTSSELCSLRTLGVALLLGCFSLYYETGTRQGGIVGAQRGWLSYTNNWMRLAGGVLVRPTLVVLCCSSRYGCGRDFRSADP